MFESNDAGASACLFFIRGQWSAAMLQQRTAFERTGWGFTSSDERTELLQTNNVMKTVFIILLALALSGVEAFTAIPLLTPFDHSGNYSINGTVQFYYTGFPQMNSTYTVILDAANSRMFSAVGPDLKSFYLNDKIYIVGDPLLVNGSCAVVNATYADTVAAFTNAFFIDELLQVRLGPFGLPIVEQVDLWSGVVDEAPLCGRGVSILFETVHGVQRRAGFTQRRPIPGTNVCLSLKAVVTFDPKTLQTLPSSDSFPSLPASCATPVPWCPLAYPDANVCVGLVGP